MSLRLTPTTLHELTALERTCKTAVSYDSKLPVFALKKGEHVIGKESFLTKGYRSTLLNFMAPKQLKLIFTSDSISLETIILSDNSPTLYRFPSFDSAAITFKPTQVNNGDIISLVPGLFYYTLNFRPRRLSISITNSNSPRAVQKKNRGSRVDNFSPKIISSRKSFDAQEYGGEKVIVTKKHKKSATAQNNKKCARRNSARQLTTTDSPKMKATTKKTKKKSNLKIATKGDAAAASPNLVNEELKNTIELLMIENRKLRYIREYLEEVKDSRGFKEKKEMQTIVKDIENIINEGNGNAPSPMSKQTTDLRGISLVELMNKENHKQAKEKKVLIEERKKKQIENAFRDWLNGESVEDDNYPDLKELAKETEADEYHKSDNHRRHETITLHGAAFNALLDITKNIVEEEAQQQKQQQQKPNRPVIYKSSVSARELPKVYGKGKEKVKEQVKEQEKLNTALNTGSSVIELRTAQELKNNT